MVCFLERPRECKKENGNSTPRIKAALPSNPLLLQKKKTSSITEKKKERRKGSKVQGSCGIAGTVPKSGQKETPGFLFEKKRGNPPNKTGKTKGQARPKQGLGGAHITEPPSSGDLSASGNVTLKRRDWKADKAKEGKDWRGGESEKEKKANTVCLLLAGLVLRRKKSKKNRKGSEI